MGSYIIKNSYVVIKVVFSGHQAECLSSKLPVQLTEIYII